MGALRYLTVLFLVSGFGQFFEVAQAAQTLSVRVDPAYFYNEKKSSESLEQFVGRVTEELKSSGAQTLFVQAYSPVYGAFYPTDYAMTDVERGLGAENVFAKIVAASRARGMKVVAMVPVNSFASVWKKIPGWRVKGRDGADLPVREDAYLLSTSVAAYQSWYAGFLRDLLKRHPDLAGVEAMEPLVDSTWKNEADFHPDMKAAFEYAHPGAPLEGKLWRKFVAQSMTHFLGEMFEQIKRAGREAYVVQTWAAGSDGKLLSSEMIREGSGFDFQAMQTLPESQRPSQVVVELIWQQWKALHGGSAFDSHWTAQAIEQLQAAYAGPVPWIVHLETSEFASSREPGRKIASVGADFKTSLREAWASRRSVDLYSYHLLKKEGLMSELSRFASEGSVQPQ